MYSDGRLDGCRQEIEERHNLQKPYKMLNFALSLPDSIMVVRQILDLNVEVRALVRQLPQKTSHLLQEIINLFTSSTIYLWKQIIFLLWTCSR